jgi:hypothetical protein
MNTYLGEKEVLENGAVVQEVLNIDESIGKCIRTKEDMLVLGDNLKEINIKSMDILIEDVIRTCGLYLFCKTEGNFTFAIRPEELEKFEVITAVQKIVELGVDNETNQ